MLEVLALPLLIFWASVVSIPNNDLSFFPNEEDRYNSISSERPKNLLSVTSLPKTTIHKGGDFRYALMLGDQFLLFRNKYSNSAIDYSFGGAIYQQYDLTKGLDGLGYNGNIYSTSTIKFANIAIDLSVFHISAHLSDEYIENTGRERIEYARNEYLLGARYSKNKFMGHIEVGYDYSKNIASLRPWRFRHELQYQFNDTNTRPYVAFELESKQENDWDLNTTFQAGYAFFKELDEKARVYLEYYRGNSKLLEFYQDQDNMISFGIVFYR